MEDGISKLQTKADQRLIADYYDDLSRSFDQRISEQDRVRIRKAFEFANEAHAGVKRKSGEPYIIHPIAVANIVSAEIGLGATSIIAAILHDVVEDTDYTLTDMENLFGVKVARIVDGLTKLSDEMTAQHDSKQAINFRKMLMTLSDDVRVILIKLADRLHNMRTLESMAPHKQLKIAAETLYIFAPLAHRLGLYAIKTELEDLSLKYKQPETYNLIKFRLHSQKERRDYLVDQFITPIQAELAKEGINFTISGRLKSIYSIWNKMQSKGVSFDEIYDLMAIRIVFRPNDSRSEKRQCFDILSLITDIYKPKPDRIRDWITIPKANGYEALHVTVMGPAGKWVEVQIRTERMDAIAERGFAAHYKYKGDSSAETELDRWLEKIREMLQNPESDALEFLDEFKMNLYSREIVVFTPKGKMVNLPKGATVTDFAYEIHTDLGNHCIGAKINHKLMPMSHVLSSGDQVEILTSKSQRPDIEWLKFITTAKAKSKIKQAFKLDKRQHLEQGREIIEEKLKAFNIKPTSDTLKKITAYYNLSNKDQLYAQIGMGFIDFNDIENILKSRRQSKLAKYWKLSFGKKENDEEVEFDLPDKKIDKKNTFILKENPEETNYTLAKCCQPIPGENVLGYLTSSNHVVIHKRNCPVANKLMSQHGDRIITAEWTKFKKRSYLTRLKMNGFDRVGIVSEITNIISKLNNINMRTVMFDTHDGIFEGELFLYIHNVEDLNKLIARLMKIKGIEQVERMERVED
ncbi:GTP pyrophosphokinase [Mangrovibacterium marinum]|uniref:GTP pyrophosphokinase n=1 Tax=Mangrovibacterium marinum TaxID=1639118 RepID=A0A2T5C5U9_9BACT|nr:bifunctional (p)ppGpp synthetase/guanosine-3',5'-bis(diphosphate) 3'-pyrophosphohydrolase [Mangrovibacterium marinum]PTN10285.1 GTP pyrophosphokinase [Mangrovibacterium marinum]